MGLVASASSGGPCRRSSSSIRLRAAGLPVRRSSSNCAARSSVVLFGSVIAFLLCSICRLRAGLEAAPFRGLPGLELRAIPKQLLRLLDRRVARLDEFLAPGTIRSDLRVRGGVLEPGPVAASEGRVVGLAAEHQKLAVGRRERALDARALGVRSFVLAPQRGDRRRGPALNDLRGAPEETLVLRGTERPERDELSTRFVYSAERRLVLRLPWAGRGGDLGLDVPRELVRNKGLVHVVSFR